MVVRKVLPGEFEKYRAHLKALDPDSRHLRFGYNASDESIDAFCNTVEKNSKDHMLFCVENDALEFIGIGHVSMVPEMELAFSVLKEYQGQGLGNKLMKRCIRWCRTKGILKGCMVCLAHNATIRHLCTKNGIMVSSQDGEALGDIQLREATVNTYIAEATAINSAVVDFIQKRAKLPWVLQQLKDTNVLR